MEYQVIRNAEEATAKLAGTCGKGHAQTSFALLRSKFGEPTLVGSGDGKRRVTWVLEFKAGIITIYDYKESQPLEDIRWWHIGSNFCEGETLMHIKIVLKAPTKTSKQIADEFSSFLEKNKLGLKLTRIV